MTRSMALVSVAAMFVTGVLVGVLATALYFAGDGPPRGRRPGFPEGFRPQLERVLDLTPEQKAAIDRILEESHQEAEAMRREFEPAVIAQMETTHRRISEILTPEQTKKFEQLRRHHRGSAERFFLGHPRRRHR